MMDEDDEKLPVPAAPVRTPEGRFPKGVSGNAAGRRSAPRPGSAEN
jgi:hypothetical protein